jgi:hypothetical protein
MSVLAGDPVLEVPSGTGFLLFGVLDVRDVSLLGPHTPRPSAAVGDNRVVRDIEVIDSELRLVAAVRQAVTEMGGPTPAIAVADQLLDERADLGTTRNG